MLGEEAEGWNGKHERSEGLHKRTRGRLRETPCAAPGQRPQRGLVSLFARTARTNYGSALRAGARLLRNSPVEQIL